MRQDDPDDHDVSDHGHRYDGAVGDGPQRHLPGRLDQAVGVAAEVHRRDGGSVRGGRSGGVVGRLHLLCVGPFARVGGLSKIDGGVSLPEGDSRRGEQRGRMRPRGPERSAALVRSGEGSRVFYARCVTAATQRTPNSSPTGNVNK